MYRMNRDEMIAVGLLGAFAVVGAWLAYSDDSMRDNPVPVGSIPNRMMRDVVRVAVDQGWRLEHGGKHFKLYSPDGRMVTISGTPSDTNAYKAAARQLRHAGVSFDRAA